MRTIVLPFLVLLLAGTAHAQNWIVFIPAERDFRVLFPEPPARRTAPDGSTVYRARIERNDYEIAFSVYRLALDARLPGDARSEIQQRLQARNEDRTIRYVPDEDPDRGWERHVFRQGSTFSVHRLVRHRGRYFELEVSLPRGSPELAVHTARDFFNSFQVTGAGLPPIGTVVQRIETWCQGRKDSFSQAFCQYSVCLQPGYEKYPHCSALAGLRDFF